MRGQHTPFLNFFLNLRCLSFRKTLFFASIMFSLIFLFFCFLSNLSLILLSRLFLLLSLFLSLFLNFNSVHLFILISYRLRSISTLLVKSKFENTGPLPKQYRLANKVRQSFLSSFRCRIVTSVVVVVYEEVEEDAVDEVREDIDERRFRVDVDI